MAGESVRGRESVWEKGREGKETEGESLRGGRIKKGVWVG